MFLSLQLHEMQDHGSLLYLPIFLDFDVGLVFAFEATQTSLILEKVLTLINYLLFLLVIDLVFFFISKNNFAVT